MSSHVPVPGAFCEVDKDNATRDTSTGQGMFVSATRKAVATDLEHSLLDLVIFDSVASASARADAEKAAAAGAIGSPAPDITTAEGFVKKVDNVKRQDLHHFTSKWRELLRTTAPPPPPPISLVGRTFQATLPVTRPSGISCESVVCTVKSDNPDGTIQVEAKAADGVTESVALARSLVEAFVKAAPPPPPPTVYASSWNVVTLVAGGRGPKWAL